MSKSTPIRSSNRLAALAFVVFALLTLAVVASEARSANHSPAHIGALPAAAAGANDSLLVARIARMGLSLCCDRPVR